MEKEQIASWVLEGMPFAGDLLSLLSNQNIASKDRELKLELAERNERLQKELEEHKAKLQVRMQKMNLKQKKAMDADNRKLQIQLSRENRQLQWDLAVFAEYSRRKHALWEIGRRFQAEQFPLYIRKENYYDFITPDHAPAVKIVFSPPVIDHENRSGHVLEGIDVLMTARLTRFLHKTFDNDSRNVALYEYLGNAWRDKMFRGQSAYRYIFNEFSSEPFIIVDCEAVRGYLTFQLCYWMPGFSEYKVLQVMEGFPMEGILYEAMRKRVEEWESTCFSGMMAAGMTEEAVKELNPEEFYNRMLLQKEREITGGGGKAPAFHYQYAASDYDAVIDVVALLAEIFIGVIVDLYQMSTGNLHVPCFLDSLKETAALLPEKDGLRDRVEQMAVKQYLKFADPDREGSLREDEYMQEALESASEELLRPAYDQPSTAMILCRLILAEILEGSGDTDGGRRYFESAWKGWCRLLGLPDNGIEDLVKEPNVKEALLDEFRNDSDIDLVLLRFHQCAGQQCAAEYKHMINRLMELYDDDWSNNPHLYL